MTFFWGEPPPLIIVIVPFIVANFNSQLKSTGYNHGRQWNEQDHQIVYADYVDV